jgi:cytoskeletal protein CcmA (bactofilin family)
MLGINRPPDSKDGVKPALKPALYESPGTSRPTTTSMPRAPSPPPTTPRESTIAAAAAAPHANPTPHANPAPAYPPVMEPASPALMPSDTPGSKLFVGINIKLKGVEISDCDTLVIEGQVEATVHSKQMEVSQPGTLHGTALIDVAEVHGEFSGELTARTRLIVHGTGRVSGTIRYGKLVVEEGGELSGDVKRIDAADAPPQRSLLSGSHSGAHSRHQNAVT